MEITTKELRLKPGKFINYAVAGQEITVTFRGKALVKLVPIQNDTDESAENYASLFGLWKNHAAMQNVDECVRDSRKGRQF